jgi:hypothetical protein
MKRVFSKVVRLKAVNALIENRILFDRDSSPSVQHWVVTQASGDTCDVWRVYNFSNSEWKWSCNAVGLPNKKGEQHGCVFYKGDQSEPFCSHTLGAFLCKR